MRRAQGFTLIEALISSIVLLVVSVSSISLFYKIIELQKNSQKLLGLITRRNTILGLVVDEKGWKENVLDAENSEFNCWLDQSNSNVSNRDCFNKSQSLKLKWLNGDVAYNSQLANNGLNYNGENCSSFKDEPEEVNKQCGVKLIVNWKAVCEVSPCENPLLQVDGSFIFRSDGRVSPNMKPFQFRYFRSKVFCPSQSPSTNIVLVNSGVSMTASTVKSMATGLNSNSGMAKNNVDLYPCQFISIKFNEQVVTNQASLPSPLLLSDANNISVLCLSTTGSTCEFIWKRVGLDYQLYYKNTLVAQKPNGIILTSATELEFQVINGLVRFCADSICHMFFDQKISGPFRIYFEPSNSDYSDGFTGINIQSNSNLSYTN